jgi:hypothetical protein
MRSVARLVNREERLRRRMARVTGRLAGRTAR